MMGKRFELVLVLAALGFFAYTLVRQPASDGPLTAPPAVVPAEQALDAVLEPTAVPRAPAVALWAEAPSEAEAPATDAFGYPRVAADRLALLGLLRSRELDTLDSVLTAFYQKFLLDFRYEWLVADSIEAFQTADPELEEPLTEWIRQRPRSVNALLARAAFLVRMAWHARGGKFIPDTSSEQITGMDRFFDRAEADIEAALRLDPDHFAAFELSRNIAMARGAHAQLQSAGQKLLEISPLSFLANSRRFLAPRWGGSYLELARLASQMKTLSARNPRLAVLQGYADWDRGRTAAELEDSTTALRLLDQSLAFGDHWQFLQDRGELLYRLKDYKKALADFDRLLDQRPQQVDGLRHHAMCLYNLVLSAPHKERRKLLHQARADLRLARALDRSDTDVKEWLEFVEKVIRENCRCP